MTQRIGVFLEYILGRLKFNEKWIERMRVCVFGGRTLVLVNGNPTLEVNIQRGLQRGDIPLLLVVEGFDGLCGNKFWKIISRGSELFKKW